MLDTAKLKAAQEELEKKSSGGSKNWIQASKITEPIDVRIMDPLPEMDGIYFLEVPVWWINGKRVVSPAFMNPGTKDKITQVIAEAKASGDKDVLKLLAAKDDKSDQLKVSMKSEYWIPVLKFNWNLDKSGNITGIGGDKVDLKLVRNFIEDDRVKILVVGINLLKDTNKIATSRGGAIMTDPIQGFNLQYSKSGEKRNTKYSVIKTDIIPMPEEFYFPDMMTDPYEIAQSQIFTDEYMDKVIGWYLYGEDEPGKPTDDDFLYPDLREKLKNKLSEEEDEVKEAAPAGKQRPGRTPQPAQQEELAAEQASAIGRGRGAAKAPDAPAANEPPAGIAERQRRVASPAGNAAAEPPATTGRTRGAAAPSSAPVPPAGGRRGRNLADDITDVEQ